MNICELALSQRTTVSLCVGQARLINMGFYQGRAKASQLRWIKREISYAIESEKEMIMLALQRCDNEGYSVYDLVGAITNLTKARINRLAYAGRVLP